MTPPSGSLLYLSGDDVAATGVTASAIADRIEQAFAALREGRAWNVPKASLTPGDGRLFQAMLAVSDAASLAAVKSVALVPGNAARGLPHISALITVFDTATARPVAVMEGAGVTAVRTAAMTLAAGRRLARADSAVIGFVGTGVQARSHLAAFAAEFPLTRVLAVGRSREGVAAFLEHARGTGLDAEEAASPGALLAGSDIVVSSVPAAPGLEPMLDARRLREGGFAGMCDNGRSWRADGLAAFDRLLIDDLAQESEARAHGLALVDESLVGGDLAGLVSGDAPARAATGERTAFMFRGLAIADLAAAALVLDAARERGLGRQLPI